MRYPAPAGLALTSAALALWPRLTEALDAQGLMNRLDANALGRYCQYLADWAGHNADLSAHGIYQDVPLTGRDDTMQRFRPSYKARKDCETALKDLEDRFGLTPLARLRIQVQQANNRIAPGGDLFNPAAAPGPAQDTASPVGFLDGLTHPPRFDS